MMTLKLDMKHICKKDVRRKGGGGGIFGLGRGLWEVGEELCSDAEGMAGSSELF